MQSNAPFTSDNSSRKEDINGFITIEKNPISRSGVFQYLGRSLPDAEPDRIYNVLRPEEELNSPEAIDSFKMLPLINEHVMLGEGYNVAAEEKGVHGSTGEDVHFENGILYAPLKIFSKTLKQLIDSGKKALSMGYRCAYEKTSGVFEGQSYDYIQRNIRGNHIALVGQGRMGKEVAVLDSAAFDHFDLALDTGDQQMADENTAETEVKEAMGLEEACALLKTIVPQIAEMQGIIAGMKGAQETEMEAGDEETEEKPGDEGLDNYTEEKKDAMDAAEIKQMKAEIAALKSRGTKEILADLSARNALAKEVSQLVGTFDHADMTTEDVTAYAMKHFGLSAPKGQEQAVLTGYLAGRKSVAPASVGFAMDSAFKKDSLLAKRLATHNA